MIDPDPQLIDPDPPTIDPEPQLIDPDPQLIDPEPQLIDPDPQSIDPEPPTIDPDPPTIDPDPPMPPTEPEEQRAEPSDERELLQASCRSSPQSWRSEDFALTSFSFSVQDADGADGAKASQKKKSQRAPHSAPHGASPPSHTQGASAANGGNSAANGGNGGVPKASPPLGVSARGASPLAAVGAKGATQDWSALLTPQFGLEQLASATIGDSEKPRDAPPGSQPAGSHTQLSPNAQSLYERILSLQARLS